MSLLEITLPANGPLAALPMVAELPAGARRGIVVLHEVFGRQPEIDRVVQRFAAQGWAAVAPDLYGDRLKPLCIREILQAIATGRGPQVDQVQRARDWLTAQTGIPPERMAVIGFCMGAGLALAVGPNFAATSSNYGDVPSTEVLQGLGPTIGCYGGRDRVFARSPAKLRTTLEKLQVPHEVHVYDEVGHSFLTDGHHPVASFLSKPLMQIEYKPAVAEAAWAKILAFLEGHVGG